MMIDEHLPGRLREIASMLEGAHRDAGVQRMRGAAVADLTSLAATVEAIAGEYDEPVTLSVGQRFAFHRLDENGLVEDHDRVLVVTGIDVTGHVTIRIEVDPASIPADDLDGRRLVLRPPLVVVPLDRVDRLVTAGVWRPLGPEGVEQ